MSKMIDALYLSACLLFVYLSVKELKFGVQFDEIETSVICGLGTGMDSSRPSNYMYMQH